MIDFTQLLISPAFAQTAADAPVPPPGGMGSFGMFVPMVLILAVFYVLIIRPQNKKLDEQTKMLKALRKGDRVVTSSGIHGKIVKLDGDENVVLEIADGVQVKMVRSHVASLAAKTDPASVTASDGDDADKKN